MKVVGYIGVVLTFLLLGFIIAYCFLNESGHGPDLQEHLFWFCLLFAIGLVVAFTRPRNLGICIVSGSIIGILFTSSADSLRIMMGYEEWIEAGMPEPNPSRMLLLAGALCASFLGLILPLLTRTQAEQNTDDNQRPTPSSNDPLDYSL